MHYVALVISEQRPIPEVLHKALGPFGPEGKGRFDYYVLGGRYRGNLIPHYPQCNNTMMGDAMSPEDRRGRFLAELTMDNPKNARHPERTGPGVDALQLGNLHHVGGRFPSAVLAYDAPFADWLVNDLEDCTKAIPLGGNIFKDKRGTPDIIGKRESKSSDILKMSTEIVSAEIKLGISQLVIAFGQACAYGLYAISHIW